MDKRLRARLTGDLEYRTACLRKVIPMRHTANRKAQAARFELIRRAISNIRALRAQLIGRNLA